MKKPIPFEFVLEALQSLEPYTKPMFGCLAVYVGEKIVLILRNRPEPKEDNGIWVATIPDHHSSLKIDLPSMRSIKLFGPGVTGWQVLPVDSEDFEAEAMMACKLILRGDPRIGKIPAARKKKVTSKKTSKKGKPKVLKPKAKRKKRA